MHIRAFAPQDEPAVVALWQQCDLTRARELLLARGRPKVSLLVRNSNAEAIGFYRHLGYLQDDSVSLGKRLIADA